MTIKEISPSHLCSSFLLNNQYESSFSHWSVSKSGSRCDILTLRSSEKTSPSSLLFPIIMGTLWKCPLFIISNGSAARNGVLE